MKELKKETHYRENNQFDYSYEYEYNINGNRTKVTRYDETESILSEDEYTYSNIYKDRLESVTHNNTSLYTFSYQGSNFLNPSSITKNNNTKFLSWHGRRLTSIGSTSFNYNESGIRIRKDNTNDETSYYINSNNKVLRSNFIDINHNNYIIDYHYDESGSLIGLHFDGKEYFYKKDILGIINEIIDEEGTPYVYYKYTAYGIPTLSINTNLSQDNQLVANILLNHNIYIYKDYIYDRDIDMYYLNSRYYDPYIGRFISIDAIEYLDFEIVNGLNLYAYCMNNPVVYKKKNNCLNNSFEYNDYSKKDIDRIFLIEAEYYTLSGFNSILASGSFRNGVLFGNGTITGLYANGHTRLQVSLKSGKFLVGAFGKFSTLNATGQIGVGNKDLSVSLIGVADFETAIGMIGIIIDPSKNTIFAGVEAKASMFTARGGVQFNVFDTKVEVGGSVNALSVGFQFGIGIKDGEFYYSSGIALLFGYDFYIRVKFS